MKVSTLLAILPVVLAAETTSGTVDAEDAVPSNCNSHCGSVIQAQIKLCPNDNTGECICSLSDEDFWSYFAECDCTNPTSEDVASLKSMICSSIPANAGADDFDDESTASVESDSAESTTASTSVVSSSVGPINTSAPSGYTSEEDDCNIYCEKVDAIGLEFCPDEDMDCLCQISDSQYWNYTKECNCINNQNLTIEEIKARICRGAAIAAVYAGAGLKNSTTPPSTDTLIAEQTSTIAAYTSSNNTVSNNTGSNNTSSNHTSSNHTSSNDTGSNNTGSNNTGSNNTGSNNTGSNNTGSNKTGSNNTGSNDTGSNNTGSNNVGSNNTSSMTSVASQNQNMGSKATVASLAALAGFLLSIV